jgi:hypothetical protein
MFKTDKKFFLDTLFMFYIKNKCSSSQKVQKHYQLLGNNYTKTKECILFLGLESIFAS